MVPDEERGRRLGATWVRPELGSEARRAEIRDELAADPIGVMPVDGLLDHAVASDIAAALEGAAFSDEYRLAGAHEPVTRSVWLDASDDERLWYVGRLSSLSDPSRLGDGALGLLELRRSRDVLGAWLTDVLGAPVGEGSGPALIRLDVEHSVRPHILDPARVRCRVDIVLSHWDERWGGRYVAVGPAERTRRLDPIFGSAFVVDAARQSTVFVAPRSPGAPPMLMLTMTFASTGIDAV